MLETIVDLQAGALGDEKICAGEPVERGLKDGVGDLPAYSAEQRVGEIPPQDRADLRDFARFAKPVEPRGERLLQGRRDGLSACSPRSTRRRVTSSTNSGRRRCAR